MGNFDLWNILFLIAAAQGLFLSIILYISKSPDRKNLLLGTLILFFSISLFDNVWFWSEYFYDYPHLLGLSMSFPLFYGPLVFLYLKEAMEPNRSRFQNWGFHLLPGFLYILYLLPFYLSTSEAKLVLIYNWFDSVINALIAPILTLLSQILYTYFAYRLLKKYQLKKQLELLKGKNWLGQIYYAFLLYVFLVVINYIFISTSLSSRPTDYIIAFGTAFFIYSIGYIGLSKSKLLNGIQVDDSKYKSTSLTKNASKSLFQNVKRYLEETKAYTDNQLRLPVLAKQLSITPHQLSQVINEHSKGNFSEFINAYRVEEAKRKILSEEKITYIAYDVGFNNKTSFNLAFKKFTGLSPTAYKKQKLNQ